MTGWLSLEKQAGHTAQKGELGGGSSKDLYRHSIPHLHLWQHEIRHWSQFHPSILRSYYAPFLWLNYVIIDMSHAGLANPGEAFTVFYGERNPWCEYQTLVQKDFSHSIFKCLKDVVLFHRDYHSLSRQPWSWLSFCGEHCRWEAGKFPSEDSKRRWRPGGDSRPNIGITVETDPASSVRRFFFLSFAAASNATSTSLLCCFPWISMLRL